MPEAPRPRRRSRLPSLTAPPSDPSDLATFPARSLAPEDDLYRIVHEGLGPWWFGHRGDGRFDLEAPHGTCYLAREPLAALLDVIGPNRAGGAVSRAFLAARRMRRLRVPKVHRLADLVARRATAFGVTGEIGLIVPYDLPQQWAGRLHEARFEGVVYRLRHDPAGDEGLALFGAAGERRGWRRGREEELPAELLDRLEEECGIEVLDVPKSSQLKFVDS
ncbi:MAG: RES domain-containing protein [Acidobacteriota bacterium]